MQISFKNKEVVIVTNRQKNSGVERFFKRHCQMMWTFRQHLINLDGIKGR